MGSHVHRSIVPPPRRVVPETPSASVRLQEQKQRPETIVTSRPTTSKSPQRNTEILSSYQQDAKVFFSVFKYDVNLDGFCIEV